MATLETIQISWRTALMFAICLPMAVVALMLVTRSVERRANAFLACFLFAVVLELVPQIIGFSGAYSIWPGLTYFPFETELYLGALLYLHAWTLMNSAPIGWRWYLLVPGFLQTAYYSWAFLGLGDYKSKWAYNNSFHEPYLVPIEIILAVGFVIAALVLIWRMIRQYEQFLSEFHSAKDDYDPVWLRRLSQVSVVMATIFVSFQLFVLIRGGIEYVTAYPVQLVLASIIGWLGLEALSRTSRPFPKIYKIVVEPKRPEESAGDLLTEDKTFAKDWLQEGKAIKAAVLEGDWFLIPSLSLKELAKRMHTNETYVSRAINLGLGTNFNHFINQLRIEHAKGLLARTQDNVLEVALDSGFNSKSTFNRVFREMTGQTPTQYRKSLD